ncbi:hypothetical protein D3C84_512160 [compost metagenome]
MITAHLRNQVDAPDQAQAREDVVADSAPVDIGGVADRQKRDHVHRYNEDDGEFEPAELAGQRIPDFENGQRNGQQGEQGIFVPTQRHLIAHLEQQPERSFYIVH